MIGEPLDEHIRRELAVGENVVWSGRPAAGIRLRMSDFALLPFALFWTAFAVFWEATAVSSGAPWFFRAFGSPFVLIGVYITIGRFFFEAALRSRTAYCLTDRRALIVSWFFVTRVRSVNLRALPEMSLLKHGGGMGSIVFGARNWATRGAPQSPRFEWISDANHVYGLALATQAKNA